MEKTHTKRIRILALVYAVTMLALLFLREITPSALPYPESLNSHVNLVPFKTIHLFIRCLFPPLRSRFFWKAVINLIGNVILFLPLGYFPPALWARLRRYWKTILLAAAIMCCIEIAQMLLLVGTCDIDDLILNLAGASIGYGIYRIAARNGIY